MTPCCFYCAADSPAAKIAASLLHARGIAFVKSPSPAVTHVLTNIPTTNADALPALLQQMPAEACIIGGNLPLISGHPTRDLLQDPIYVAENAYITAHCAVRLAMQVLPATLRDCKVLVIGWGRIGKCLAVLLKSLEAQVTVAARKETDRGMLQALGYQSCDIFHLQEENYRIIFNTVPVMVLPQSPKGCIKIDLASTRGIGGDDVIHARGLPGKDAAEASGELIARRILAYLETEGYL